MATRYSIDVLSRSHLRRIPPNEQCMGCAVRAAAEAPSLVPSGARDAGESRLLRGGDQSHAGLQETDRLQSSRGLSCTFAEKAGLVPQVFQVGPPVPLSALVLSETWPATQVPWPTRSAPLRPSRAGAPTACR